MTILLEKKIFTIYGHYPIIRASLRRRGWAERKFPMIPKSVPSLETEGARSNDDCCSPEKHSQERALSSSDNIHDIMSRLIQNEMPYFIWTVRRDVIDYHHLTKNQMLNHYGRTGCFTTKIGLCLNLRNLPWYVEANPDTFFPRCYSLCSDDEKSAFIDDFRHTAVFSILKWVVLQSSSKATLKPADEDGTKAEKLYCPQELLDRAYAVCEKYIGKMKHDDIDLNEDSTPCLTEMEWDDLLKQYYVLVHGGANLDISDCGVAQCREILMRIESANPQLAIDGIRNVWIIKPGAKSRGRDIVCMDKVEDILRLLQSDPCGRRDHRWIVQKYIERPLLIYNTKFDIRQWFLVTDWNPLTVWFYKDCYLRFSTQHYTLDNLESCVHLCNNSIQKHFKNCSERNPLLPRHNMWGSMKFKEYLHDRGFGGMWDSVIYPAMKNAITYTVRMAQDTVEPRKNSFELYGADFILGEDFKPWLIEINSSPTLFPSTPITAHLCAQVQEDLIKVVIDRQTDKSCNTGKFELLWKQPIVELPTSNGISLLIEGSEIKRPRTQPIAIPTLTFTGHLSGAVQQRAKYNLPAQEEQIAGLSKSLKCKSNVYAKKERLLLCSSSAPAKCAPVNSPKSKGTPLQSVLKIDKSGLPSFKTYQILNIPKVKQKILATTCVVDKPEADAASVNANAVDWTVLQPSNISDSQTFKPSVLMDTSNLPFFTFIISPCARVDLADFNSYGPAYQ
ncbi:protein monoglycylase TTLL8 [Pleurodeles waltl]|uniref:protein monoglycylase TTLL8 n=1 Tax=Pleurodeles waltl TaxID=8319 RepID=UPI00370967C5